MAFKAARTIRVQTAPGVFATRTRGQAVAEAAAWPPKVQAAYVRSGFIYPDEGDTLPDNRPETARAAIKHRGT